MLILSHIANSALNIMNWQSRNRKWILPKSRTAWLFWWTKLLQNLIKMNFADVRSFSAQLILSLHTQFKLKMFVLTLLNCINDVIIEARWIKSKSSCHRSRGNLCQIYSPWRCCVKCFKKNSTNMIRCRQVTFFQITCMWTSRTFVYFHTPVYIYILCKWVNHFKSYCISSLLTVAV